MLLQYPATNGAVYDYRQFCERAHAVEAMVTVATDLMSLVLLTPPGEWGADICVGNSQRFGVPLGFGGPHAAFFSTRDEYKRHLPGRIIGVSRDADGKPALRMALQTREQHIRRDKATSNICTAQVLLAVIAGMYAVYHGPERLTAIASRIHELAATLAAGIESLGYTLACDDYFDTICVEMGAQPATDVIGAARAKGINLRALGDSRVCIALDETTTAADVDDLLQVFATGHGAAPTSHGLRSEVDSRYDERFARTTPFLTHQVFHNYHSETEMLRYLKRLENRDLSLTTSMIPLGSCTMKLNATAEMYPVTWPEFGKIHPFAPAEQTKGYREMFDRLEQALAEITGFAAVSLQPNAGSQGEYAGLLVIRAYHEARNDSKRNVCLIPQSAHGTNPASAVMAGMKVVVVKNTDAGDVDMADLEEKAKANADVLAALMITYPSHVRRVRRNDRRRVHDHSQVRRPGVPRRREHERDGRPGAPGRRRRGRLPSQPSQDVLHSARRRRSGDGADRCREAPRRVPARESRREGGRVAQRGRGLVGAVGKRQHSTHFDDVHRHDGRHRAHGGDQGRDSQRELHREAARVALSGAVQGQAGDGGARVHRRSARRSSHRPASRSKTSRSA